MKFLGIIPSRYASTRLEGKPLADICGKPMIQHVYERASEILSDVFVATDDERIEKVVKSFGGKVVMTSLEHNTGTNRCLEAYQKIQLNSSEKYDIVINIQGDEPLLHSEQITGLMNCFEDGTTEMATLVTKLKNKNELQSKSEAFVTFDINKKALYFSRNVIPGMRDIEELFSFEKTAYYKHVGMYAYTPDALKIFAELPQSNLELIEGLEQNRWLENGHSIVVNITEHDSISVDTIEDLEYVRKLCINK